MAASIELSSFSLRYSPSAKLSLETITLSAATGSCVGIVGPTGAGKSTLLHALSGILGKHHVEASAEGRMLIADMIFDGIPRDVLFPTVGLVLQDPFVQISGVRDTVREEISFTLENIGKSPGSDDAILELATDLGIEHLLERKPTTLSGGETQRVALGTILVARPRILLLDEPVASLDAAAQDRLRGILRSIRKTSTIVLTDTQLDFPLATCDQIAMLQDGHVTFFGSPHDLFADPMVLHSHGMEKWKNSYEDIERIRTWAPGRISRLMQSIGRP
jgi:energy-coupling factor transport system ATP-binding protein